MGFLDDDPELVATKFSEDDLERARTVLAAIIGAVDAAWLRNPVGPLASHWNSNGQAPATYLIHVAQTLYQLDRSLTTKSVPIFRRKVQGLLRPPRRPRAFEELLSELEVGALLSHRASPISFEPLVPRIEAAPDLANSTKSPDFGLRLPDGDVCFEVTNVHIGYLDNWDALMDRVASELSDRVLRRGIRRRALLRLPLSGAEADVRALLSEQTLQRFDQEDSGKVAVKLRDGEATIEWSSVPHLELSPGGEPDFTGAEFPMSAATVGGEPGPVASIEYLPDIGLGIDELILRSIRNSLRAKRKQMVKPMPYVLVARLGHHRLNLEGIGHFIQTRILPNPDYAWITAIALFIPARNWETRSADSSLLFHINQNSRYPASESLIELVSGTRQFHLP